MPRRNQTIARHDPGTPPDALPQLPHERDESIDPPGEARVRGVVRQAKHDLDKGRVDTDNYTRVSGDAARVLDPPRGNRARRRALRGRAR